ncbi:hypothetical protein HBI95_141960 [Parastagonospora nodorum]|nr:hypothetical protein HBI95_141960 [Parastagonospora nodorum]
MLTLSKIAQQYVALLTKLAILNNANIALVDAVIDALTMTLIKNDDDLLGTVNSYIKLRRLRAVMLLLTFQPNELPEQLLLLEQLLLPKKRGRHSKLILDRSLLKRRKTKAADSRHAKASRGRTKKDKDLEDSNTSSDQLGKKAQLKKTRDEEELAKAKKEKEEKESLCKSKDGNRTLHSRRLTDAYILYFKELLSNNSGIFANAIGIGKTRAIVLAVLIGHFCFFSDSLSENIGRLTKEEAIKMRINTTNAISKALAAVNKLTILEANTPAVHPKAMKHCLALLAAQFIIVCGFRKVDKHVFRAYNTISVTAQRTIIRKGSSHVEKRAILLPRLNKILIFVSLALISLQNRKGRDSVTSDRIYKIEDARNIIANIKHDASEHESSYKDILEKEGLNKLEASRRVIFNCFKMQAIASYPALATLKAAQFKTYSSCKVKRFTLNSVKDLFTNLSKDYFLVREARAITKSSLKFQNLLNLCSKIIVALIAFAEAIILTEATHVVIIELQDSQLAEMYVSIIYFNPDSKLELKVLGKQDVKITS